MPEPGEAPSTELLNQLVSCMREGNTLYDDSIQHHRGHMLSVYGTLEMLRDELVLQLDRSNQYTFDKWHSFANVVDQLTTSSRKHWLNVCVLVVPPSSLMLAFLYGHLYVFDSHAHQPHGGAVLIVPNDQSASLDASECQTDHLLDFLTGCIGISIAERQPSSLSFLHIT